MERDWTVAPGEILLDLLHDRNWSVEELAHRCHLSLADVQAILRDQTPVDSRLSTALQQGTGVSARLWQNLQQKHDQHLMRKND